MSDNQDPAGAPQPHDPWAPPSGAEARGRVPLDKPGATPPPSGVHDQPTVTGMPGAGEPGSVPAPPPAPGGYGYPGGGTVPPPSAAASGGFGAPADSYGGTADPYGGTGAPGYPAPYAQPAGVWAPQPANGLGITAMVLGIVSIPLFCVYGVVSIVLGILGVIFGVLGRKRAQRGEATNGGMALAGIITGAVGIVLGILMIILVAWGITTAINEERYGEDTDGWDSGPYSNHLVVDDRG
ncbi:DUF4190 domain-containing protein [Streptomyces sp. NPDC090026]|uniref:DUF4190 domain-containing protein n=1 Tax=Streptomyces sp. NPDC090026 TaxID=3365923 RepID=UPI003820A4B8